MPANNPRPPKRSWRGDRTASSRPSAGQPAWKAEKAAAAGPRLSRGMKIAIVLGLFLFVAVGVVAVYLWLQPPDPFRLVLVGAGYEKNLALDPNVLGRRGLADLATWAGKDKKIDVKSATLDGQKKDPVADSLPATDVYGRSAKTVVVFLSGDGGGDDKGAYLWLDGANPKDRGAVYPISQALKDLSGLPKDTKKLLLLDASHNGPRPAMGQLHNDFVRALTKLDLPAFKMDNLVVLCSCDVDQQSWDSEEYGQTIFGHYVLEGLKGAADQEQPGEDTSGLSLGGGRVTALSLARYVQCKVKRWVRHNRASDQVPVLIDDGNNAAGMELGAAGDYKGEDPAPSALAKWSAPPELDKAWTEHDDLAGGSPPPYVNTPLQWREYEATLLRYEQLLRDGLPPDAEAPKALSDRLYQLSKQIKDAHQMDGRSLANSLATPAVFGRFVTPDQEKLAKDFDKLWDDNNTDDKIKGLLDKPGPGVDRTTKQVLRLYLIGLVLAKAEAASSPDEYKRACNVLATLTTGDALAVPLPAEANFAVMAQRMADHLPPSAAPPLDVLQKAVTVRQAAETAALGMDGKKVVLARSELLPWIRSPIEAADAKRRVGEDLLFSSVEADRKVGRDALTEAGDGYEASRKVPGTVRHALRVRDQALAELPYFTEWRGWEVAQGQVADLRDLWAKVYRLCDLLDAPEKPEWQSDEAAKATADLEKGLAKQRQDFDDACDQQHPVRPTPRRQLEALLSTPLMKSDARKRLLDADRNISWTLNEQTKDADPASDEAAPAYAEQARKLAGQQVELAAAALREDGGVGGLVKNALKELDEKAWQVDIDRIGATVAKGLSERAARTHDAAEKGRSTPLADAAGLHKAALDARFLDAGEKTAYLGDLDPVDQDRRLRLQDLLLWQAERSRLDFWVSDVNAGEAKPYYQSAGHACTDDAARLATEGLDEKVAKTRTRAVDDENGLLDATGAVQWRNDDAKRFTAKGNLPVTDEVQLDLQYTLVGDAGVPQGGRPVVWAAPGTKPDRATLLKVLKPVDAGQPHALAQAAGENSATFVVQPHPDEGVKARWATGDPDAARFQVSGLFRGRYLTADTKMDLYNRPDVVSYQPPQARYGYVAVQADEKVFTKFAAHNSEMVIVLDYSGSMTETDASGKSRIDRAKIALKECLRKVPDGVPLTVLTFSADSDADIVVRADKLPWNQDRTDELMNKLRDVHPQGYTPLVRATAEAANYFDRDFPGAKTIVVLTDGGDNEFYSSSKEGQQLHAGGRTMEKYLHDQLGDKGIQVNVVGFQLDLMKKRLADEKAKGGRPEVIQQYQNEIDGATEYETAIERIGGKFIPAEDTDQLAATLQQYFLQIHYWVEDDNLRQLVTTLKTEDKPTKDDKGIAEEGLDISTYNENNPKNLHELLEVEPGKDYWVSVENHHKSAIGKDPTHVQFLNKKVHVEPGQVLVLDLIDVHDADDSFIFQRDVYTDSPRFTRLMKKLAQAKADPWLLTVLGNIEDKQTRKGREITTALDQTNKRTGDTLALAPPQWTWFTVTSKGDAQPTSGLRFYPRPYFAAPVWGLDMAEWSPNATPVVEAWWKEQLAINDSAFKWTRGGPSKYDYKEDPSDLHGQFIQVSPTDDKQGVVVESVEPEQSYPVQVAPGNWEMKKCMVVRLSFPPGQPYFVLPPDAAAGCEHRFYMAANRYTGVFFGVDPKNLASLKLYSVRDLQSKALHAGPLPINDTSPERPEPLAHD